MASVAPKPGGRPDDEGVDPGSCLRRTRWDMLVLSRKQGESVVIGRKIQVRIERIGRHRVVLVIDAPRDVAVDRREVWLRKRGRGGLAVGKAMCRAAVASPGPDVACAG